MRIKTLIAALIISATALGACQPTKNNFDVKGFDISNRTWTDGLEYFTPTKCDSGYNCEGGTLHEGGILFMLVPTEDGFVSANGFRGIDKNDPEYWEGYVFGGEVGEKYKLKNFNDKPTLVRYGKDNKAIEVYFETNNLIETMNTDLIRYQFSGEFTKEDGTKVVFSAEKPIVSGLSQENTSYVIPTVYDIPSSYIKLGKETYSLERTDEGMKVQPVIPSTDDDQLWEESGKPFLLKRVAKSEDQTGNISKEVLTIMQLGYFTKNEREKMLNTLKAKGDKATEIETINMQLLENMASDETTE